MCSYNYDHVDTINAQVHSSTKHTPFELVFGQPPRSVVVPDARLKGLINEEDLELNVPTGQMKSAHDTSDVDRTTVELTLQHNFATTIQGSSPPSIHDSIHDSSPTVLDTICSVCRVANSQSPKLYYKLSISIQEHNSIYTHSTQYNKRLVLLRLALSLLAAPVLSITITIVRMLPRLSTMVISDDRISHNSSLLVLYWRVAFSFRVAARWSFIMLNICFFFFLIWRY